MKSNYYTCKGKKLRIDNILSEAASLFTSSGKDSTIAEINIAKQKEKELINQISKIDKSFAEKCGWKP
tara:strand:+ start:1242 stop:1445 length:204 start_codon:yes stop_codon:yes gene_type:complete